MLQEFTGSQVALVTPMNEDSSIDWNSTEELIEWHIKEGTNAIIAVGTTGESPTLSHKEHREFISFTVEKVKGRIPVIAGTGSNSAAEAIELTQHAKEIGADAALLVVPYYNKPTQPGLIKHFSKIAEEVSIPQILYNVPSRTITDLLPETVSEIAKHKNVIGIKEASGEIDRVRRLKELCDENFILLSGDDESCCEFMLAGGHGCISVTANIVPSLMSKLCSLATSGKHEEARAFQNKIMPLHKVLFLESNPIPIKYALFHAKKIKNSIRLPLTELSEAHRPQLEKAMDNFSSGNSVKT